MYEYIYTYIYVKCFGEKYQDAEKIGYAYIKK